MLNIMYPDIDATYTTNMYFDIVVEINVMMKIQGTTKILHECTYNKFILMESINGLKNRYKS